MSGFLRRLLFTAVAAAARVLIKIVEPYLVSWLELDPSGDTLAHLGLGLWALVTVLAYFLIHRRRRPFYRKWARRWPD
jgi:hypothetical protein